MAASQDLQTITIASGSGHDVEQGITKLRDDLIKVADGLSGSGDPTAPPDGRRWTDSVVAATPRRYAQIDGAKADILYQYKLFANLDVNGKQLLTALIQQLSTGNLVNTKGRIQFDSTLNALVIGDGSEIFYLDMWPKGTVEYKAIPMDLNVVTLSGGTLPTASVATRRAGWVMDDTTKLVNFVSRGGFRIPRGWIAGVDMAFDVDFEVIAAETANDLMDGELTWRTLTPGSDDDEAISGEVATVAHDIGSTGLAANDIHRARFVIDHDAVGNVIAKADLFSAVFKRTSVGGAGKVANIAITGGALLVPCYRGADAV